MPIIDRVANYIQNTLWSKVTLVNYLLLPFSLIYILLCNFRYYFLQTPNYFQSKIICVGNSISGGAGKTPVVIRLIELLKKEKKIAVVIRGYRGSLSTYKKAVKVDLKVHSYKDVGDEAILIAQYTDVFVSASRKLAIEKAQKAEAEIIILDDGFQDNSIHKDLSILVADFYFNNIKNNFLIPAGPMRESLTTSLKKSDIVIAPESGKVMLPRKYLLGKKVFKQRQIVNNAKKIQGNEYILLCAIARPERVISTVQNIGAKIKESYIYNDHYIFSHQELEKIYNKAREYGCKVLTTKKDYVRLNKIYFEDTVVIDYCIKINHENKLKEEVINLV